MDKQSALLDVLRIDRPPLEPPSKSPWRWPWAVGIAVVVIIGGVIWVLVTLPGAVSVHSVTARALGSGNGAGSSLDASGYVVALREATVSAKGIYKVNELLVQEGQAVKQGEVIARLDDTNTHAALEQSRAQVKQLEAALLAARVADEDARPVFLRNGRQLEEGLISHETFEASKASYDAKHTAVLIAEQNLAVAKATVVINERYEDDTVIRAPFDGVVTVKNAQPGEIVSPQFSGGGGIAKIVDMDSLEVDVDVSENFINRVHAGQAATVTLNAYPGWPIAAAVIALIPTADRAKATVKVRIGLKQKDPRIVPEMGARVAFLDATRDLSRTGSVPSAETMVPTEAVQGDGESGIVYVINGDFVERRTVRMGARNGDQQTILSGLAGGTVLAVGDFDKLRDRARVRVER